jgi:hypothetical protein
LISGGFVPRAPILDGPFYESKYERPYHTTGLNIPEAHMSVDITVGTIIPPSITMLPKTNTGKYFTIKLKHSDQKYWKYFK